MRRAEALKKAYQVTTVLLDKTGTITRGEPAVTDFVPIAGQGVAPLLPPGFWRRLSAAATRSTSGQPYFFSTT